MNDRAASKGARTRVDERLSDVSEDLIGRVLRLRQAEAMLGEIDAMVERLQKGTDSRPPPAAVPPPSPRRREPASERSETSASSAPPGVPEEAMLQATQMAVAGSAPEEIEAALRHDHGDEVAGAVIAEIFG